MTITTTENRYRYTGDGSTTAFSFPRYVEALTHIQVYVDDVLKTVATDYTIAGTASGGVYPSGVTVTFLTAPAAATKVVLYRAQPLTQEIATATLSAYRAASIEDGLNRAVLGMQKLSDDLSRTPKLAKSTALSDITFPAASASKLIRWNSGATDLEAVEASTAGLVADDVLLDRLLAENFTPTGGSARTLRSKVEEVPSSADFGADTTNTNDAQPSFVLANAKGDFYIPAGSYRVAQNWTPTKTVRFASAAKLYIDDGVTVDFTSAQPEIHAPRKQRFYFNGTGTGGVSGLDELCLGWFAGDKIGTTTDALTEIQKAYNACTTGGLVKWPRGSLAITGATAISVAKAQHTVGHGKFSSDLSITGAATNGFSTSGSFGAHFEKMRIVAPSTTTPTSGVGLLVGAPYTTWAHLVISGTYDAAAVTADGDASSGFDFDFLDTLRIGLHLRNGALQCFFDDFQITSPSDRVTVSGVVGTFTVGETVTGGTSGATGTVSEVVSATIIRIKLNNINFTNTETITGGTSGATATVGSTTRTHQLGGIRLDDFVEGCHFTNADIIGGTYALITAASVNAAGSRPAYCTFRGIFFDSADEGVSIGQSSGLEFASCWFSNRPGPGVTVNASINIQFNGGRCFGCGQEGVKWTGSSTGAMNGVDIAGVNQANSSKVGINVESGCSVQIRGGRSGSDGGGFTNFAGAAAKGVFGLAIQSGGFADVDGLDVTDNVTGGIFNGSAASRIRNCRGHNPVGASAITVGASPYTYTAGASPETVYVSGGTVSQVSVAGVAMHSTTNVTVHLEPYQAAIVTYSSAPFMNKSVH